MKYIVYCTTNIINQKIYIGVHETQNPEIFDYYIGNGVYANRPSTYMKPKYAFHYAVKKYGPKNFKRAILYIYDTLDEALLKEGELVTPEFIKLNTNYNMIPGGGQFRTGDPIYQFNKDGSLVKKWKDLNEVASYFNCNVCTFRNALHFKENYFGYFWSRKESIDIENFSKGDAKKIVYQYLPNGKLYNTFQSLLEASKAIGTTPAILTTAIQGQTLYRKEYYYSYQLYDTFIPKPKKFVAGNKFYLYDLEGNFIREFKNHIELKAFMGVKSNSSISDVINRRNGLYKNWQITIEYFDKIPPAKNKSKAKKVKVFDKEGNFIKVCDSVAKAAKEFNVRSSGINRVLRGLACTTGGYIFKFDNDIV